MKFDKTSIIGAIILSILVISTCFFSAIIFYKIEGKLDKNPNLNLKNIFTNGWKEDNGYFYYYKNGEYTIGWLQFNNQWYYFGSEGKMRTGWIKDKEHWYYLNDDGTMASNITIEGYYLNEHGMLAN